LRARIGLHAGPILPATQLAFLLHNWPSITIAVTAAAIASAAVLMLRSMPPRLIVMATGPEGSRYYDVGERYRAALARANIEVRLISTVGSVENLAMLLNSRSGASVALIEGGIIPPEDSSQLASLGTVFYDPLWWFHRREIEETGFDSLRGQKISIGAEGSGTRALSLELIKRSGMEGKVGELLPLPPRAAAEKLLAGEIDVAFIVTTWESPVVQQLVADERIAVSGFPQADALVALYPFLHKVILPRGVINFGQAPAAERCGINCDLRTDPAIGATPAQIRPKDQEGASPSPTFKYSPG
jgi:TRAP-type uncharacterized transport system substrate-binding protein